MVNKTKNDIKKKCSTVTHRANYGISAVQIKNAKAEKDLRVTRGSKLDSSLQCSKVVSTANKVLSVINRTYVYQIKCHIMHLHMSLARPHLEYSCQVRHPIQQKGIYNIKIIQRTATRIIPGKI